MKGSKRQHATRAEVMERFSQPAARACETPRSSLISSEAQLVPDGDGTLLDHSMITYGSGLSDGNAHEHHNLPTIVAASAGGAFRGGRHIQYTTETPMANLFLTMLDRMSVRVESFGNSTGQLGSISEL
jgi:hypothetical protein